MAGLVGFDLTLVAKADFNTVQANREYLLSSVSQALAAVFALSFSVTLVAAQFATRYSPRALKEIFDRRTLAHFGVFAAAVAYPWFLLRWTTTHPILEALALGLGLYCLVWLISYFASLTDRLSPGARIEKLEQEAAASLLTFKPEAGGARSMLPTVDEIEDVAAAALGASDFTTFRSGMCSLAKLWAQAFGNEDAVKEIGNRFRDWIAATDAQSRAAVILSEQLGGVVGLCAEKWQVTRPVREGAVRRLVELADTPRRSVHDGATVMAVARALGAVTRKAASIGDLPFMEETLNHVERLGVEWLRISGARPYECVWAFRLALGEFAVRTPPDPLALRRQEFASKFYYACREYCKTKDESIAQDRFDRIKAEMLPWMKSRLPNEFDEIRKQPRAGGYDDAFGKAMDDLV